METNNPVVVYSVKKYAATKIYLSKKCESTQGDSIRLPVDW